MLTLETVSRALPPNLKNSVSQNLVDTLNNISSDPMMAKEIQDNFISYSSVLREGKYKTEDYINAVTFVTHKLMGDSNKEAYFKTFPDRMQILLMRGTSEKDIASYVSAYNKNKLVNSILEQSLVPSWVLNQDLYQKALNVQADLMVNSKSDKVRSDAAHSLLQHLSKPKETGPLINIDMRQSSGIEEMRGMISELATKQQELISAGVTAKTIAAQKLIDVDAEEADVREIE